MHRHHMQASFSDWSVTQVGDTSPINRSPRQHFVHEVINGAVSNAYLPIHNASYSQGNTTEYMHIDELRSLINR